MSERLAIGAVAALALAGVVRKRGSHARVRPLSTDDYAQQVHGQERSVRFTPKGLASIALVRNIQYLGFMVWMRPSEFLALNPLRGNDPSWMQETVRSGEPLAIPYLIVEITNWGPDTPARRAKKFRFKTTGHEGRTRMLAILSQVGDIEVPVAVAARYIRDHQYSPKNLTGALIAPDQTGAYGKPNPDAAPFRIRKFALSGKVYDPSGSSNVKSGYMPPFGGVRKRQVFDEAQGGIDQNPMRDIDELLVANRDPAMELGYVLDWLEDERAGGRWGANTYWYRMPFPQLSVEKLLELPGQKGQHRHMGTSQQGRFSDAYLDKLADSMRSQGFEPDRAIQVFTWSDGTAKIWEGNHRLRAAKRAGLQTIPVDWRYVAGSERDPKATHASEFAP